MKSAFFGFGFLLAAPGALSQKLELVSPLFSQIEDGPALRAKAPYQAGETLFFSCQVSGYKVTKDSLHLEWTVEAVDEQGVPLVKPEEKSLEADLAPEDKDWKPKVRFSFDTPPTAVCDNCRITLKLRDKLAGSEARLDAGFALRGPHVQPGQSLIIRNFRFLRRDEDGPGLATPSYRSGDELWARFEITGYRFGDNNRIQVEYGLRVFRPSGKILYEEPKAASFEETSFYPKRWVQGALSLRLDKLPPGEYPIVIEVRDKIGSQAFEAKPVFHVE
ncbi:MAG: hypothetical protein HY235_23575 [Acidobacteria bacterium]|nr:hypothetical protein [Acidobacteriota bacterium]